MTSTHSVHWTHDRDTICGRVICDGENAICRLWHAGGDEDCRTAEGSKVGDKCSCGAVLDKYGECGLIEWFDGNPAEFYDGPKDVGVHDGLIDLIWTGDGY